MRGCHMEKATCSRDCGRRVPHRYGWLIVRSFVLVLWYSRLTTYAFLWPGGLPRRPTLTARPRGPKKAFQLPKAGRPTQWSSLVVAVAWRAHPSRRWRHDPGHDINLGALLRLRPRFQRIGSFLSGRMMTLC